MSRTAALLCAAALLGSVGCAAEAAPVATSAATSVATEVSVELTVPKGVLAAVPFQNRLDVAQGIFQLKLYNGTDRSLDVVGVQLVWDGMTTEVGERQNPLAAGDRLDFPVPLAAATCKGDGGEADMPDPNAAVAKIHLADGTVVDAPVYDVKHFARALYLDDCSRQRVLRTVDVAWADLHEDTLEQRPVTVGALRLTRREGTAPILVVGMLNTINYTVDAGTAEPLATLAADAPEVDVPVTFLEGRCDVHGLSESSQPFKFEVIVDLGDGVQRSIAVVPAKDDQLAMRKRSEAACAILDEIHFVGQS